MMRLKFILSLTILVTATFINAQQPSYVQFTINEGLPSNTVYYAIQDQDGYIWFGTDKGISRYNGRNFVTFSFRNGLSENEVFDLFEDRDGRIWFAGFNGIPSYYHHGKFYGKEIMASTADAENGGTGLKILQDKNGTIYYCAREAAYRVDHQLVQQINMNNYKNSTLCYAKDSSVCLLSVSMDSIYLTNLTNNKRMALVREPMDIAPRLNSKAIILDEYLYFSSGNELISLNLEEKKIARALTFEGDELLQVVTQRNAETLWLGTKKGLYIFNVRTQQIERFLFPDVSVSSIFEDLEGNLWITSLNSGVYQVIDETVQLMDAQSGLGFNNCQFISVLDSNEIVIGSKGFKCIFIRDSVITNITLPQYLGEGKIQSVKKDPSGNICISAGISYYRLNKDYKLFEYYDAAMTDVTFLHDRTLYAQGDRILVVTDKNMEPADILNDTYIHSSSPITLKSKKIFLSRDSSIYAIGTFGVRKIVGKSVEKYTDHLLLNSSIVDFVETPDGLQWFGSSLNGIIVVRNNQLLQITTAHGLTSDFITCLEVSPSGDLWAGTQGGISKISYDTTTHKYEIQTFKKSAGLVSDQVNDISFFNDQLWVATDLGICIFQDLEKDKTDLPPSLVIEALHLNGKAVPLKDNYELSYNQTSVKIVFVGILLKSPENVSYRYRIGGPDENWEMTQGGVLEYPSLSIGEHNFEIEAIGSNSKSSKTTKIIFTVSPPFYLRLWFLLLILVLVVVLSYYLINRRIRILRKDHQLAQYLLRLENEKLENENKVVEFNKNLIELEQKALMLHMNPHFIFNSINAINGFYSSGDIEGAKLYVNMFSKLLRSILDFSQKKLIPIEDEVELLHNYLRLNQLRFNNKFVYDIEVDPSINQNMQQIPPMVIQPFVENAIIHGIATLESQGKIKIRLYIEGDFLVGEIIDNGIGLTASANQNKNRLHTSTGIKISKERIQLFVHSKMSDALEIIELKTNGNKTSGTLVRFKLLLENLW